MASLRGRGGGRGRGGPAFGSGMGGAESTDGPSVGEEMGGNRGGRGGAFGPRGGGNGSPPQLAAGFGGQPMGEAMANNRGRGGRGGGGNGANGGGYGGNGANGGLGGPTMGMGETMTTFNRGRGGRGGNGAPPQSFNSIFAGSMGGLTLGGELSVTNRGRGRGGGVFGGNGAPPQLFNSSFAGSGSGEPEAMATNRGRGGMFRGGGGIGTFNRGRGGGATASLSVEEPGEMNAGARGGRGGRGGGGAFLDMRREGGGGAADDPFVSGRGGGYQGRGGGAGPGRGGGFRTGANNEPVFGAGQSASSESQHRANIPPGLNPPRVSATSRPASRYIPPKRPMGEIFKEDNDHQHLYVDIVEADDKVGVTAVKHPLPGLEDWRDIDWDTTLYSNIVEHSHYVRPRKIQASVIPYILDGRDMKCLAETGSGKTGAFMIPIIQKILSLGEEAKMAPGRPFAIILEPTRELCVQVYEQGAKLANNTFVEVAKAYGEYDRRVNGVELRRGCHILCATPGRLRDFIASRELDLSKLIFFVLDEADHMLEAGFLDDVRHITSQTNFPPKDKRQTLLLSATFPREVQELADEVVRPDFVMATNNKPVALNTRVEHTFLQVSQDDKTALLKELLDKETKEAQEKDPADPKMRRTLVFTQTCRDCNILALFLIENGFKAQSINSDRSQEERELAFSQFRKGELTVIVSTDVMARGIDVKDLDHVINFDLPYESVTFVHRIGRTGRLSVGYATSFVDKRKDEMMLTELKTLLQDSGKEVPRFFFEDPNDKEEW